MAEKVELIIEVQNADAIRGIKETQNASQQMSNTVVEGNKKSADSVKDLERQMKELFQTQKKGFSDIGSLKEYEQKMAELKRKHEELTGASQKTVQATEEVADSAEDAGRGLEGMAKKAGLIAAGIALLTKLMHDVVAAFKDTTAGLNAMTTAGEFWRQMTYNIATGNLNMSKSFEGIAIRAKQLNDLRKQERIDLVDAAKKREQYNKLYFESSNRMLTDEQRLEKMNEAMKVHNEMIDIELRNTAERLIYVKNGLIDAPKSNKLLEEQARLEAELINIQGRRWSETKRLEAQSSIIEKKIHEDTIKRWHDEIEEGNKAYNERLKAQKEYQKMALRIVDEYEKSQIESLEGKEKLEAQRAFGIKQIKELKTQLASLGLVTEEQTKMLQAMADNVWKEYYKALAEVGVKPTAEQQDAISKALLGDIEELPGLVKKDVAALQKEIDKAAETSKEKTDIWDIIGIDIETEEGREKAAAIQDAAGIVMDTLDNLYASRVENAARERELIEYQISNLERSLDLELSLMEEGYANSVAAKQEQLEELKAQREEALAAEQEALKKQQAYERISQTIALASSVANILKTFTGLGPWGLALAAVAIAAMWGIWSAQKSKISGQTKFAEGGSGTDTGIVTGRSHTEGGERLLDHVEVERGEAFGVLSRHATDKYGKVFHEMVSSFNRDEMPEFVPAPVTNSVRVENSGPNSRLDKVIKEQRRLNDTILRQSQIISSGGKRIIKTGNTIRIVG